MKCTKQNKNLKRPFFGTLTKIVLQFQNRVAIPFNMLTKSLFFLIFVFHGINGLTHGIVTNVTDFGDGIFHFKNSKEIVQVPETAYEEELYIYCHNGKQEIKNTNVLFFNFR